MKLAVFTLAKCTDSLSRGSEHLAAGEKSGKEGPEWRPKQRVVAQS